MSSEAYKLEAQPDIADDGWVEPLDVGYNGQETCAPGTVATAQGGSRYVAGSLIAGKYQLCSALGEGGMGSVWVAKNRTLDVEVALKLMRAELAEDIDGIAERMLQEARAAACIGHPAIIQVFDFGFTEYGDPFIVMELLRGESLAQAIHRRGRLRSTRAAQTLLPMIDALAAVHERGIVHRDLKPENIFLARPTGQRLQPKVLDFGIAKLEQRAAERITRNGALIGSPAYMAPEQLSGQPDVDARADVWALSVVLYEMVTGRRPFEGESYHVSMWKVMNAPPTPIAEHGVNEPELWSILERGLARDRAQRFPDMRSFGRALASFLLARGVTEDVCDASLRAWFEAGDAARPLHSFFPSHAPDSLPHEAPAAAELAPTPETAESAENGSGLRRILVVDAPRLPTRMSARRRTRAQYWLVFAAVAAALLAFFGAALFAARPDPVEARSQVERTQPEPVAPRPHRPGPLLRDSDRAPERPPAPIIQLPLTGPLPSMPSDEARPLPPRRGKSPARRTPRSELKTFD